MSEVSRWMPASACSTASLADRGGSRFRLLTVGRSHLVTGGHPLALPPVILVTTCRQRRRPGHSTARSRSGSPATRTRPPGCRPVVEIAARIDAGELRLDINERGLLTDSAVIHERAGDLRGRIVVIPEG